MRMWNFIRIYSLDHGNFRRLRALHDHQICHDPLLQSHHDHLLLFRLDQSLRKRKFIRELDNLKLQI